MKNAVINIKTTKDVKENARKVAKELGLSLSDVLNASLRNFVRTRTVVFSSVPEMTPELESIIGIAEKDIKAGKNLSPTFSSSKEMLDYLHKLCK